MIFDTLQSPILAEPSLNKKILADFKSRCNIFKSWRAFSPRTIWINISQTSVSSIKYPLFLNWIIFWYKSPLSAYSIIIQRLLSDSSMKASLYEMTKGNFRLAKILSSFNAFYFSLSFNFWRFTFFKAYMLLSALRRTL